MIYLLQKLTLLLMHDFLKRARIDENGKCGEADAWVFVAGVFASQAGVKVAP